MSGSGSPGAADSRRARPTAVAGLFYPSEAGELRATVDELVARAASDFPVPAGLDPSLVAGVLVPHAGLVYSGIVAAAAWRVLFSSGAEPGPPPTVVLLGTNHGAAWLDGVGAWDGGPWRTPLGDVAIDGALTDEIVALGEPFGADARCHLGEHSIEVQLPFLARLAPGARIVALSVRAGTGSRAIEAGGRLGALLAERRAAGGRILLAISSDMAHYPAAGVAERVTAALLPHIEGLAPETLAEAEHAALRSGPGVSCGMCGIEPTVLGLAAFRAMGARPGVALAAATSADAGGDPHRTVGYLSVAFVGS